MRIVGLIATAAAIAIAVPTAHAQRAKDLAQFDVVAAVGEIGPGWVKKQTGEEGVTYVCESDACGGRGVVGIGQAKASPDYVTLVVADPEKALNSYRYATDESMRPSGCTFKDYDVRRLTDRRIQYESKGACPEGAAAAMSTIFDVDRLGMISVQVLTNSEANAVKLRDASVQKLVAALDGGSAPNAH